MSAIYPTPARLHELFIYDPETGCLEWRKRHNGRCTSPAGHITRYGYRSVSVGGKAYFAHRLIWLYLYGEHPSGEIDHISGVREDNRPTNLRDVTRQGNRRNTRKLDSNTSGITGVHWDKTKGKWMSYITVNGKFLFLGYSEGLDAAALVRKAAEARFGFHPNHGRS